MIFALITVSVIILAFALYLIIGHNNNLKRVEYVFESDKINREITFVHLGDLHGTEYGRNNETLLEMIAQQKPDALLMTGDMLDEVIDLSIDLSFLKKISPLYPIYAVAGNHEEKEIERSFKEIKSLYREHGVILLEDSSITADIKGEKINICGVDIPKGNVDPLPEAIDWTMKDINKDNYTIMLFHRPDPWRLFSGRGIDLMLSGHTHGGHWIVPGLINGIFAPEQGLFPRYAGGLYRFDDGMFLEVTRGLSLRSTPIPRAFNRPELVVLKLIPKKEDRK